MISLDEKYDINCDILRSIEDLMENIYCKYFENAETTYDLICLSEVAEIVTGGTPSTKNAAYWSNGIYYWYTPTDITTCNNLLSLESDKRISISGLTNSGAKLIPPKSVLMTSRATIGDAVINLNEATTNQGMLSIIPKDNKLTCLQLYFWIKRNKFLIASIANGSTFKEIYKKDFQKLLINVNVNSKDLFNQDTQKLFDFYESLVKENHTIIELKKEY